MGDDRDNANEIDRSSLTVDEFDGMTAIEARRGPPPLALFARFVSPLIIMAFWVALPLDLSPSERLAGVGLFLLVPLVDGIATRLSPDQDGHPAQLVVRFVTCIGLTILLPEVWHIAAVAIGMMLVGAMIEGFTRRQLTWTALIGLVPLAVLAVVRAESLWYISLGLIAIFVTSLHLRTAHFDQRRATVAARHQAMVMEASIFSWERERATGRIVSLSGNVEGVLGYRPEDLIGHPLPVIETTAGPLDAQKPHDTVEVRHRNGSKITLRQTPSGGDATIERGTSVDTTDLARVAAQLRHRATHDPLTDLANRSVLEAVASDALAQHRQTAVILVDLDRFKEINDTLGHPTGDRVLQVLGQRLRDRLDDVDVVARLGGDEFAAVVSGHDVAARSAAVADKIYDIAADPIDIDGMSLAISSSVGVAVSPDDGTTFPDLFKHADVATYRVKSRGGGVERYVDVPGAASRERLKLAAEARRALEREEFELFYQPKVSLADGSIVGAEGLARWRHPDLGVLAPGRFLEAIEVGADFGAFTLAMVESGIRTARRLDDVGVPIPIAVNLNSRMLFDTGFPSKVAAMLRDHNVSGAQLVLEITETELFEDSGLDRDLFSELREIGVRVSIDDFGTGYSSLARLRAIDVDEVKIDRQFVSGLGSSDEDEVIVDSVIRLARLLDYDVVAEGVETEEQASRLRDLGCAVAQGFHFDAPMPQVEFVDLARHIRRYAEPTSG